MLWVFRQLESLIIGCLLLMICCLVYLHFSHYDMVRIQSNSMAPTFSAGDAVLIDTTSHNFTAGQIVAFRSLQTGQTITHRIVLDSLANRTMQTQGDNLQSPDSPIPRAQVRGRAVLVVGKIGTVADSLHTPIGFSLLVVLPITAVLTTEVAQLALRLSSHDYRAASDH